MIALDVQQGTEEWLSARCGIPTASEFDKIITTKGERSKQAEKYLYRLAGERITGRSAETFRSKKMEQASEMEAEARAYYDLVYDVQVDLVGICYLDEARKIAASPDALSGKKGLLEIKCPEIQTHVEYLVSGGLPTEYFQQIQGQLYVTGREWCDFLSYYPGIKPHLIRVKRDEKFIALLSAAILKFCGELDTLTEKIK